MTSAASNANLLNVTEKGKQSVELEPTAIAEAVSDSLDSHSAWMVICRFPTRLTVVIPIRELRVRDLLALRPGQILPTAWNLTDDVPLSAGPLQFAWGEFDVLNENIALRLTRLA